LNTERRMSPTKWLLMGLLFLLFAFIYMGKSGKADFIPGFAGFRDSMMAMLTKLAATQIWVILYGLALFTFGLQQISQTWLSDRRKSTNDKLLLVLMALAVTLVAW